MFDARPSSPVTTVITALLVAAVAAGCGKDRTEKRIAEATKRAKAKEKAAEKEPPPPPPPPPALKVTAQSGAAALGKELPKFVADEAISADDDLRERIIKLAWKPPNKHTVKMLKGKGPAAIDALSNGLWHRNGQVRAHSARLLSKLEGDKAKAVANLTNVLRMDPVATTRAAATAACVDLKLDALGAPLIDVLRKDKDDSARANAAWALGKMRHKAAVDALVAATLDSATWVRIRSATALGRLKARSAVRPLEKALSDPNGEVRKSAARALKKLTGKNYKQRTPRLSVK